MTDKLKPCPCCNHDAKAKIINGLWYIECTNGLCHLMSFGPYGTEEEAIKAWNTRADDWQPIDTAPKDGTMLLLWSMGIHLGSWRVDDGYSGDKEPSWFDNSCDSFTTGYSATPLNPTHWKHLPEPPTGEE
jgi:hypothetical protein